MKYFDLHADTAYRCLGENLAFNDNALHITFDKAAAFDEWHQCFVAFIAFCNIHFERFMIDLYQVKNKERYLHAFQTKLAGQKLPHG